MKKKGRAFQNAFNGIVWGLHTQPNYKVHIILSLFSVTAGVLLGISYSEWLIIMVMVFLGFVIETINTAIEQLGDAIDTNYNEAIKNAKDSSAGAMLLFSIGAVLIAAYIFLPKIITMFFNI